MELLHDLLRLGVHILLGLLQPLALLGLGVTLTGMLGAGALELGLRLETSGFDPVGIVVAAGAYVLVIHESLETDQP